MLLNLESTIDTFNKNNPVSQKSFESKDCAPNLIGFQRIQNGRTVLQNRLFERLRTRIMSVRMYEGSNETKLIQ